MLVLRATDPITGQFTPPGELPEEALQIGRLVDYTALEPGDLILSCDEQADWVSKGIVSAQANAGFTGEQAQFTHAMMYLGNGFVLEATFEFSKQRASWASQFRLVALMVGFEVKPPRDIKDPEERLHGVFIEHLWRYSHHHTLCARRLVAATGQPAAQQELISNAFSLFICDYDFELVRKMGLERVLPELMDTLGWDRSSGRAAAVCSTFYARAHDMTFLEGLALEDGYCTPAYLSSVAGFNDVPLSWGAVG